jgi:CheY-like chemotaxis protein
MTSIDDSQLTAAGLRVLVVDDNVDAAESLCTLLGMLGHTTAVAYDGPAGLTIATAFRPQVAILDIGLPGMSGHELARRLRAGPATPELLVAVSGYARDEDRRHSHEAGFDHHLIKPVELAVMQAVLAGAGCTAGKA